MKILRRGPLSILNEKRTFYTFNLYKKKNAQKDLHSLDVFYRKSIVLK